MEKLSASVIKDRGTSVRLPTMVQVDHFGDASTKNKRLECEDPHKKQNWKTSVRLSALQGVGEPAGITVGWRTSQRLPAKHEVGEPQ